MSDRARGGRTRRSFRLECLEGRDLLSAVAPAAVHQAGQVSAERVLTPGPPAKVSHVRVVVSGLVAGDGLYAPVPVGYKSYSGHGTAGVFGSVLFGTSFKVTPGATASSPSTLSNGNALITTTRGGN